MTYQYSIFSVPAGMSVQQKAMLEIQVRKLSGVVSAYVDDKGGMTVRSCGVPSKKSIGRLIQDATFYSKKMVNAAGLRKKEKHSEVNEYRRDAITAGLGLVGLQLLRMYSPMAFNGIYIARSAFTLFVARNFISNGIKGLIKDRQPNADTLTATAVLASVISGKPESSLTLLMLANAAEMLTTYTAEKARNHISDMLRLDQPHAWKIEEDGHERRVSVESLKPGDHIGVHLGEKICVDGRVKDGVAAVDQSSITGEYIPVEKSRGAYVYAGTVVKNGFLEIIVEKVGDATALARIVHMVEEAQSRRAPVQNFADQMATKLVPISFIAAGLVYGLTKDWQRVLNILFIDYSCGLKLSTATAISAAIGHAAKRGVLIKGGNYVESLGSIDTIVLDKTGTITVGTPKVMLVEPAPGIQEKELVLLAAAAEYHSAHPLASAILDYVGEQGWEVPPHLTTETIVAKGIQANVPDYEKIIGGEILVGSIPFMRENHVECQSAVERGETYSDCGYNVVYVARDGILLGMLVINDPIRPNMKRTINRLRRIGIDEIVMLTGDSKNVAQHVAATLDIDSYHAEVLPADKALLVSKLQRGSQVMMIGDGINDAPALAFADVGVAMGGRRTDIAVESAAMTINSDEPLIIPEMIDLGRNTMKIVQQNFTTTIAVNTAAMLLGAIGRTSPMVSALIHNAATIGVVLNSARILLMEKKK
ncbi:heavy metal translocating P-type ATPase [Pelosinus propionicus]|uniref:Cd(2+)-exporting ATPase n=1 Tax=Pelosinus propionicus DSM 13327 TaxID=1123291 RepID=A0A1I4I7W5_9FIRM|nr:cation-translocating P-type ATPase [Pelosinus propionicus]SFL50374.1 cation-transporting P-type ATPase C [Pelosinus propionicus DSM 13327]